MNQTLQGSARIAGLEVYVPAARLGTGQLERRLAASSPGFRVPKGLIDRLTGIRTRSVMACTEQASDLAATAAAKLLADRGLQPADVELIIFASASQDMVEPATGHMVAAKLGAGCPVMDVKNACNSLLNGLEVADALIGTGRYRRVLLVSGESPSRAVRWSVPDQETFAAAFPGYTMSDAGCALLLELAAPTTTPVPGCGAGLHGEEQPLGRGRWLREALLPCGIRRRRTSTWTAKSSRTHSWTWAGGSSTRHWTDWG